MLMRDVVRETPGRAWELALLEKRKKDVVSETIGYRLTTILIH